MPIFLDRHDLVEASAEGVANLHVKDLQVQHKYGVKFLDIAQADAILVSPEVKDACTDVDLGFEPSGSETLRGFSEPVQLFSPAH